MSKVSWKDISAGIQSNIFKNKLTFIKKAVLHIIILMHCKARHGLRNLFSTKQENDSERAFVARSY